MVFYDGTSFHRVVAGFVIQGGGYTNGTTPKTDGLHPPIRNEARNGLRNVRGAIAMARAKDPHSATSQFFINVKDNPGLDYDNPDWDGWGYCVFGKVVEGLNVVDRVRMVGTRINPQAQQGAIAADQAAGHHSPADRGQRAFGEAD